MYSRFECSVTTISTHPMQSWQIDSTLIFIEQKISFKHLIFVFFFSLFHHFTKSTQHTSYIPHQNRCDFLNGQNWKCIHLFLKEKNRIRLKHNTTQHNTHQKSHTTHNTDTTQIHSMHEMEKNIFLIFIFTKVERRRKIARRSCTRRHTNIHTNIHTDTNTHPQRHNLRTKNTAK